jgi:4-amino-4-deoxy-L-arabinose transferase-like glycosyltransferase
MSRALDWLAERPGLLLVLCAAIFMAVGWSQDGINLDSTTYAVIARNMAEQGSWLHPTYTAWYLTHFAEHPPLVMWLQGIVFLLLGASDGTARIVGQLAVIGSIWMVYLIGLRIESKRFGFLAGLVLLLTYSFGQVNNSTLLDGPMTFFGLMALYGTISLMSCDNRPRYALLAGLGLAGAFLSKGAVAVPFWVAVAAGILLFRRDLLHKPAFWWIPIVAVLPIDLFFLLDHIYANGRFIDHYFVSQVLQRYTYTDAVIQTAWWEFSWRLFKLALPFTLLLPFGIYYAIRKRKRLLWPILIALIAYWLLYSGSAKLYYHYFVPAYALTAPLAALPLLNWLSEKRVRSIQMYFPALWVAFAIVVTAAGVRVHAIRTPEIYALTQPMLSLLEATPDRNGMLLGDGEPNWDHVAKAAWYWRSDLRKMKSAAHADLVMRTENSAWYLLAPEGYYLSDFELAQFGWRIYTGNEKLRVYVRGITRSPGELSQR